MPPKSSNDNSAYKNKIKLDLDKFKNGEFQHVKDLAKISIKTLATTVGVLSEDVNMFMFLSTSKGYYALNDRTINLLMKGGVDMSATTSETSGGGLERDGAGFSDAEFSKIINQEKSWSIYSR